MSKSLLTLLSYILFSASVFAKGQYMSSEQFIQQAFNGGSAQMKMLWLSNDDKDIVADILNHPVNMLRVRYWQHQDQTAWILNEVGKEKPITIGVHIKNNQIQSLKVLTFRETRGDEVRHEFFTKQFDGIKLSDENHLSNHIDGITGATLSVRALTKVAKLSLWLNNKAQLQ